MNLLQRSLGRQRFEVPADVDPFASLVAQTARPIDGKYEVAGSNLDEMAQKVYKQSGPVFALIAVRQMILSEARFQWQQLVRGRPGDLFGTDALARLENPWPGGTTGDLISRMELHDSLMGNAYVTDRTPDGRLKLLRPDWLCTVWGSDSEPELGADALDGELLGYVFLPRQPGAFATNPRAGTVLMPEEVAHYAPHPDPQMPSRGMSWITPVLREIAADNDALTHKQSFFRNGAVPRLAMRVDPSVSKDAFERLVAMMEQQHSGPWNAYKTLYIGGGADPVPLTFNLKDADFTGVTGSGESRLAAAAGVPPTIVGFSEGLAGSALNAGNYQQTKRRLGDGTARPLWRNMAGSLQTLFPPPPGSRLWYDDRDIAFLREDLLDASKVTQANATTVRTLVDAGFEPDAAVAAVQAGDLKGLVGKHTGLFSVQLQPPADGEMNAQQQASPVPPGTPAPPAPSETDDEDDDEGQAS